MALLTGKTIVIMGVANRRSIAWGCAKVMAEQGARIIYTYNRDRTLKFLEKLVGPDASDRMIQCDVASDDSIDRAFRTIKENFGQVDGIVHSLAFAKSDELGGKITNVTRSGYHLAQDISAYSLLAVAKKASELDLLTPSASIVTMTYFGSERAIPNYNVMGIAKAALESTMRYLARDLGASGVRVNAISAGAVKTLSVTGIKGHKSLLDESASRSVDGQGVTLDEIGGACAFLVSDLAQGITGDVIYVDKGVHLI
ncbi:enoyl-ACP reductase FabI [Lactobacillus corticis]|uniref:Enoyl-[acyl-carrier-protein] reductase [NADH] n=1 Tax=Lactobacillus corticis TaxID=2201249 RepID=A0A916QJR2_9LACO|nr:enoyl-ACP reductase FabI [Lactobacillus corticis]GFZ26590.1 enoyl-ACP reductase 1 [Lactobacillus corticis]